MSAHRLIHPQSRHHVRQRVAVFRNGFHLIDLVICLLVIAALAAVAVPRFDHSSRRERVRVAANQIAADLLRTRLEADASSETRSISFSDNGYDILDANNATLRSVNLAQDPYLARIESTSFTNRIIEFSGLGMPASTGTISVRSEGWEVIITVNPSGSGRPGQPVPLSAAAAASSRSIT